MKKLLILSILLPAYACTTSVAESTKVKSIRFYIPFLTKKQDSDYVIRKSAQVEREAILATESVDNIVESKVEATASRIEKLEAKVRELARENESLKTTVFDLQTIAEFAPNVITLNESKADSAEAKPIRDTMFDTLFRLHYGKR